MAKRQIERFWIGETISVVITLPPGLNVSEVSWYIKSVNGGTVKPMSGRCQTTPVSGRVVFKIAFKPLTHGDFRIHGVVNGYSLSVRRIYRVEDNKPSVGALSRNLPTFHDDPFSISSKPEGQDDEETPTDPGIERRGRRFLVLEAVFVGLSVLLLGFFLWRIFFLYPSF